ncbi:hypothetical protein BV378_17155 [Nostoc sp. RF31YmG]|nr:hypothetical protein BV378_17155 [Nostoc sp. RF31YmG]
MVEQGELYSADQMNPEVDETRRLQGKTHEANFDTVPKQSARHILAEGALRADFVSNDLSARCKQVFRY